jgi:hypothetical protein
MAAIKLASLTFFPITSHVAVQPLKRVILAVQRLQTRRILSAKRNPLHFADIFLARSHRERRHRRLSAIFAVAGYVARGGPLRLNR